MAPSLSDRLEDFFDDAKDAILGNDRELSLKQLAERDQFTFRRRVPIDQIDFGVRSFEFFSNKKRTRIYNVLSAVDDRTKSMTMIFDAGIRGGNKKITTCALMDSEILNLPRFIIRPKRVLEKVKSVFNQQAALARFPNLQKQMILQTKDVSYMHQYLTDRLEDFFLDNPLISVEGLDNWLMIYQENTITDIPGIIDLYDKMIDLAEILLFDHSNDLL